MLRVVGSGIGKGWGFDGSEVGAVQGFCRRRMISLWSCPFRTLSTEISTFLHIETLRLFVCPRGRSIRTGIAVTKTV